MINNYDEYIEKLKYSKNDGDLGNPVAILIQYFYKRRKFILF